MIETNHSIFDAPPPLPERLITSLEPTTPKFILRPYQVEAVAKGLEFITNTKKKGHEIQIIPTGAGKSLIIANICKELDGNILILQPNKEILEQNHRKLLDYGFMAGIYSASAGQKFIGRITFATIGSIIKKLHLFSKFKYIIIDECHGVNAKDAGSMYNKLVHAIEGVTVLGMTATPYRLESSRDFGAMLKLLTRTRPKIFTDVNYLIQNRVLFDAGYLSKLEYYQENVIDANMLQLNTKGTDFTEASIRAYSRKIGLNNITINMANRMLSKRKNLLVFCSLIDEAMAVAEGIPGAMVVTGDTDKAVRASILSKFKSGQCKCVINVGVLTTGFDYPELEAILIARSTMSLALYYQIIGRAMRIHPEKTEAWIMDLGGNFKRFGKIETMEWVRNESGLLSLWNNGRPLTNVRLAA